MPIFCRLHVLNNYNHDFIQYVWTCEESDASSGQCTYITHKQECTHTEDSN